MQVRACALRENCHLTRLALGTRTTRRGAGPWLGAAAPGLNSSTLTSEKHSARQCAVFILHGVFNFFFLIAEDKLHFLTPEGKLIPAKAICLWFLKISIIYCKFIFIENYVDIIQKHNFQLYGTLKQIIF